MRGLHYNEFNKFNNTGVRIVYSIDHMASKYFDIARFRASVIFLHQRLIFACCYTASNLGLLLQKEQNVKGGEGPSGKQAVGINNGTR